MKTNREEIEKWHITGCNISHTAMPLQAHLPLPYMAHHVQSWMLWFVILRVSASVITLISLGSSSHLILNAQYKPKHTDYLQIYTHKAHFSAFSQ